MRILVTGATGVIGSRVVPLLLAAGHDVTAAVRRVRPRRTGRRWPAPRIRPLDLFAPADVQAAVAGHDVVINLATHIPASTRRHADAGRLARERPDPPRGLRATWSPPPLPRP